MHTYVHTYVHTYIHTCIHTYIQTHKHIWITTTVSSISGAYGPAYSWPCTFQRRHTASWALSMARCESSFCSSRCPSCLTPCPQDLPVCFGAGKAAQITGNMQVLKTSQGPSNVLLLFDEPRFHSTKRRRSIWVAVKELNLSYYIGETLLFTIYTH